MGYAGPRCRYAWIGWRSLGRHRAATGRQDATCRDRCVSGAGAALEARTAEGWGRRLLRALSGKTWRLAKIDGIYGAIYRGVGWLLFTRVFMAIWLIIGLAGLAAFVLALGRGAATYQVLELNGS